MRKFDPQQGWYMDQYEYEPSLLRFLVVPVPDAVLAIFCGSVRMSGVPRQLSARTSHLGDLIASANHPRNRTVRSVRSFPSFAP